MGTEPGTTDGIVVRVLGPVELFARGIPVPIAQPGLRVLLALLALEAGRTISTDALVAAVWGPEEASRAREQNLQSRVYKLRRVLAQAEPERREPRLVTAAPGYKLALTGQELDVAVFRRDVSDGRAALRAGDATGAVDFFTTALGLWRGAALADVAGSSQVLEAAAAGLEEQRLAAAEDRADAMLAAGQHRELPGELAGLVAEHPLRERTQGLLMVALYRSGRQADALAAYQRARHRLAEELGIDPGSELRELHERILRGDPALAAPGGPMRLAAAEPSPAGNHATMRAPNGGLGHAGVAVPGQILPGTPYFAGPARELEELDAVLGRAAGTFGSLLRQLRDDAFMTQEELAEAAGLSPRSVSDLERGVRSTARVESARPLVDALGLAGETRTLFLAAAQGRAEPAKVLAVGRGGRPAGFAAATRTLPRAIAGFIGRASELADLERTVTENTAGNAVVGIHAIGGMAGIGKTTFAVHAAHRLAGRFPDGQFFLPLHGHTPGQPPVAPADALASLLMTAGVAAHHVPSGAEARAAVWRDYLAGKRILLVLDDAAGHDQVRPLLPGSPGSLVLITSRRRLTALEEAAEISLDTLSPREAAALLARQSGRPELADGDGPAGEITRLCGYLPLAIAMLARQLGQHTSWAPGDLAARLAAARDRLGLMVAENLSVAAAFDLSYADLTPGQQRLFRRLGLLPGPTVDAYAAAALSGDSLEATWRDLDGLFGQHLLTEPAPGRYLLHDLLREHARALAAAGDSSDDVAAERLLDYYAHAAAMAGKHIATRTALEGRPPPGRPPSYVPDLTTVGQAAGWLEAERPNLHAAVDKAIATDLPLHAVAIAAAIGGFLRGHGSFEQAAGLHQTALAAARQAADRPGQASAYDELGFMAWLGGDHRSAAACFRQALTLYRELGDRVGEANAINHEALVQWSTGDYRRAIASNRQALELARSAGDPLTEAVIIRDLGVNVVLTGDYRSAEASLTEALERLRAIGDRPGQSYALDHLSDVYRRTGDYPAAAACATEALQIARDLHDRPGQAWALNHLGRVQQETGDFAAAAVSHHQALEWLREIGQPSGEAGVLNSLGELSTRTLATTRARDYHAQALAIARLVELPVEEARAHEGIGRSHLQDGNRADAIQDLRRALWIYQRIGDADAERIQAALRDAAAG